MWDAGAWSQRTGTERDAAGPERRDGRMEAEPSWRLRLIGLSRFPWLTRPICSADLKREWATGKLAGQGRLQGVEERAVTRARGWSHSRSHSLFVAGPGRASCHPQTGAHTPRGQAQWTHKNPMIAESYLWYSASSRHPDQRSPREGRNPHMNSENCSMNDRKGDDETNRGMASSPLVVYRTPLETITNDYNRSESTWGAWTPTPPPQLPPIGPVRWGC